MQSKYLIDFLLNCIVFLDKICQQQLEPVIIFIPIDQCRVILHILIIGLLHSKYIYLFEYKFLLPLKSCAMMSRIVCSFSKDKWNANEANISQLQRAHTPLAHE